MTKYEFYSGNRKSMSVEEETGSFCLVAAACVVGALSSEQYPDSTPLLIKRGREDAIVSPSKATELNHNGDKVNMTISRSRL